MMLNSMRTWLVSITFKVLHFCHWYIYSLVKTPLPFTLSEICRLSAVLRDVMVTIAMDKHLPNSMTYKSTTLDTPSAAEWSCLLTVSIAVELYVQHLQICVCECIEYTNVLNLCILHVCMCIYGIFIWLLCYVVVPVALTKTIKITPRKRFASAILSK